MNDESIFNAIECIYQTVVCGKKRMSYQDFEQQCRQDLGVEDDMPWLLREWQRSDQTEARQAAAPQPNSYRRQGCAHAETVSEISIDDIDLCKLESWEELADVDLPTSSTCTNTLECLPSVFESTWPAPAPALHQSQLPLQLLKQCH